MLTTSKQNFSHSITALNSLRLTHCKPATQAPSFDRCLTMIPKQFGLCFYQGNNRISPPSMPQPLNLPFLYAMLDREPLRTLYPFRQHPALPPGLPSPSPLRAHQGRPPGRTPILPHTLTTGSTTTAAASTAHQLPRSFEISGVTKRITSPQRHQPSLHLLAS